MKIIMHGEHLFTITDIQKKVIMNDIPSEIFEEDMNRRAAIAPVFYRRKKWFPALYHFISYFYFSKSEKEAIYKLIMHKYERCLEKLRNEWEIKFCRTKTKFPEDNNAFVLFVFAQPDYKDRSTREKEEAIKLKEQNERLHGKNC